MKLKISSVLLTVLLVLSVNPSFSFADGQVFVLCYHTFLGKPGIDTDFSTNQFYEQVQAINSLGYRFVSFDDVANNNVTGKKNVLITIDDGNKSVMNVFDPILMKFGIKPVLFIYPAIIGVMHYAFTYPQLRYTMSEGAEIGGHGYNHLYVTQALYTDDLAAFKREIYRSKSSLETNLGVSIRTYAYPYGAYSPITVQHVRNAGYEYAFTLIEKPMLVPLDRNPNLYELPRYMVTHRSWPYIYNILKANELE